MKSSNSRERIQSLMDDLGVNQAEFCRKTGIKKASLSNYLSGKREPRQDALAKIADAFDVSPAWLMGYDGESIFPDLPFHSSWVMISEQNSAKREIARAKALTNIYKIYGFNTYHVAEAFCLLPEEGQKELLSYLDYQCTKHGISKHLSTEEDLENEYLPKNET